MSRKLVKTKKVELLRSSPKDLVNDIERMIEETRSAVATTVNAALTMLYWRIGHRIHENILDSGRAGYGQEIVVTLSRQLVEKHGHNFGEKNLRRMIQFAEIFPEEIVVSLLRQLSWSHFLALIPLTQPLQREFYAAMCQSERWSVRTLRQKIDSMLYERTAISRKPQELARKELAELRIQDRMSPDLVFRNPYVLDFLNLKNVYSERDLEAAILREIEEFLLELGAGFTFVARQKRMIIDNEDHYLDLLLYHRKLRRLIAIELKIGRFKAADKGQMELYLRWLAREEHEPGEQTPLGLILCTEGSREQIELLELSRSGIHVASYLTDLPSKQSLQRKLRDAIALSRQTLENQDAEARLRSAEPSQNQLPITRRPKKKSARKLKNENDAPPKNRGRARTSRKRRPAH